MLKTNLEISDISVTRSLGHVRAWKLYVNVGGYEFSGYFSDLDGYLLAVEEMIKFIAIRCGALRVRDAGLSRPVLPGDGLRSLPGDKPQ